MGLMWEFYGAWGCNHAFISYGLCYDFCVASDERTTWFTVTKYQRAPFNGFNFFVYIILYYLTFQSV